MRWCELFLELDDALLTCPCYSAPQIILIYFSVTRWGSLKFAGPSSLFVRMTIYELLIDTDNFRVPSLSWKASSYSSRNFLYCVEHEGSLPCSQELATCNLNHINPLHALPS
jgi:hypothetical protein